MKIKYRTGHSWGKTASRYKNVPPSVASCLPAVRSLLDDKNYVFVSKAKIAEICKRSNVRPDKLKTAMRFLGGSTFRTGFGKFGTWEWMLPQAARAEDRYRYLTTKFYGGSMAVAAKTSMTNGNGHDPVTTSDKTGTVLKFNIRNTPERTVTAIDKLVSDTGLYKQTVMLYLIETGLKHIDKKKLMALGLRNELGENGLAEVKQAYKLLESSGFSTKALRALI